ncbi:hypothetical protein ACFY8P_26275 [Streptomyces sp. NPDC012693]|uniref:hypothetical protein n=1 Tax=Streptomyces sp. NPDC012693 TaxID=3364844 RepID=UPI003684CBD4
MLTPLVGPCQSNFQNGPESKTNPPSRTDRSIPTECPGIIPAAPSGTTLIKIKRKGINDIENEKNLVMEILEDDNYDFEAEFSPRQDVGH